MAASSSVAYSFAERGRGTIQRQAWLILGLSLLVALPGCGGCGCQPTAKTQAELEKEIEDRARREELEKERLKPPVEVAFLTSEPYDSRQKTFDFIYKPGHWTAGMLLAKANHDDINGDLDLAVVDGKGQPFGLTGTPYTLSTERAVALPKKQPKRLETQVYLPASVDKARVVPQISARRGGRLYEGPPQSIRMPVYQYYFVVLARWPERYAYLDQIDSCHLPKNLALEGGGGDLYRVVLQQAEKQTALPPHSLFWTNTACVLWDDAEPDSLTSDQQRALLDWLHWGGQLIVSGPDSLATLKESFLGPFLPASGGAARPLQAEDLQELSRHWPVPATDSQAAPFPLKPARPWPGIALERRPEARFVPGTGDLVAERRVGRGRVVVTAFPLNGSEVTGWRGFDAFFNACLLGHPGRTFFEGDEQAMIRWKNGEEVRDPRRLSQLRYFTRDTGRDYIPVKDSSDPAAPLADEAPAGPLPTDVASWCDSNQVANAARGALKDAARIEIPSPMFVVGIVAVYLIVLVPLNWLVFRGLGRIEWAWVAAPVIAVVCTGLVIRLAQLDIGFARSATEIAVIELQGPYPRAHVTRYSALYTSLSTEYRFHADDPGMLALPFPNRLDDSGIRFGRSNLLYRYGQGQDSELNGVRVLSNSTGLVHSEQMLDLRGGCSLVQSKTGSYELVNDTELPLHGVGVMRLDEQNRLFTAWLDEVAPHSRQVVPWEFRSEKEEINGKETLLSPWRGYRDSRPETAQKASADAGAANASRTSGTLNVRELIDLAERGFLESPTRRPGDARLVAWTEATVPGLVVEPAAPQIRRAALVVADLEHGQLPPPESDSNTRRVLEVPARVLQGE